MARSAGRHASATARPEYIDRVVNKINCAGQRKVPSSAESLRFLIIMLFRNSDGVETKQASRSRPQRGDLKSRVLFIKKTHSSDSPHSPAVSLARLDISLRFASGNELVETVVCVLS